MPIQSPEARFALYLVDPGPRLRAVTAMIQEVAGVDAAGAAAYLEEFPSLIFFFEAAAPARAIVERFRELDAVAVVRPADEPLSPAPVVGPPTPPAPQYIRAALLALAAAQVGVSYLWLREGRWVSAFFGLLLAVYVAVYFVRPRTG